MTPINSAAALTVDDLSVLLDAFHADLGVAQAVRRRHATTLSGALRCDAGSPAALRALATDVEAKTGIGGEPGRQLAFVARTLAGKGLKPGPACGG